MHFFNLFTILMVFALVVCALATSRGDNEWDKLEDEIEAALGGGGNHHSKSILIFRYI